MTAQKEAGMADWEFIHDMQGVAPEMITPEMIRLTRKFLECIPPKWQNLKKQLAAHVKPDAVVYIAISDIENLGDEFKIRGVLRGEDGLPLAFHRLVIYDKDRFEDDYLGAVITDRDGAFSLAFGKKVFSDFGLDAEPDVYIKLFRWKNDLFEKITEITPLVHEKISTADGHNIIDFGVVSVPETA